MNSLDRYLTLANPLATLSSGMYPKMMGAAPSSEGWRLSSDPKTNMALWNALGVSSWAIPLAIVATTLVNARARREVDKSRDKSEDMLLASSRPHLTPAPIKDIAENKNAKRLNLIEQDALKLSKKAFIGTAIKGTVPILALPASYWLASKLTSSLYKDKIQDDLEKEREILRRLQDAEDLERLKLLGMIEEESSTEREKQNIPKKASGAAIQGLAQDIRDRAAGIDLVGTGKTLLWDAQLTPVLALSALILAGGGMYLSKRDRDTKKVDLLTKKLLGENRMYDPPMLSMTLPGKIAQNDKLKQLQRIEGLPSSDAVIDAVPIENNQEKDALFS